MTLGPARGCWWALAALVVCAAHPAVVGAASARGLPADPSATRVVREAFARPGQSRQKTGPECVEVTTPPRLPAGESFRVPLKGHLEFRLIADPAGVWSISVGPAETADDYLWLVSPPLRTAPHRQIGAGYGLTAAQSVALATRRFGFVTTAAQFEAARRLVSQPDATPGDLERQATGTLELWITGPELPAGRDELTWISVRARACMPAVPQFDCTLYAVGCEVAPGRPGARPMHH